MIEHCYGGIDVSQDRLDVMVLPQGKSFSVANDKADLLLLDKRLAEMVAAEPDLACRYKRLTSMPASARCSPSASSPGCRSSAT